MQRARAAERDECELAWIVAALDRDDAQRAEASRVDDVDDTARVDPFERALGGVGVELEPTGESSRSRPSARLASVTVGSSPPRP